MIKDQEDLAKKVREILAAAGIVPESVTMEATSRLIVDNELVLYGDVGDIWGDGTGFSARDVVQALSILGPGDVVVRMNSGGGLVTEGSAIYAALQAHPGNVTMTIEGIAASAASLIAMAANKIMINESAMVMIHDPSGVTIGTAADHLQTAEVLDKMGGMFAAIYSKRSGNAAEDVRQMMVDETWFTGQEAVDAGFADQVLSGEAKSFARFDYMLYRNAPEKLRAAQRARPAATAAAAARSTEKPDMNELEKAKAEAAQILADAKAQAKKLVDEAEAKAKETADAAEKAKAKADAEAAAKKITDDAQAKADKIVADAKAKADADAKIAADTTKAIMSSCRAAKLDIDIAMKIIDEAKGDVSKAKDLIIDAVAAESGDQSYRPATITSDEHDRFVAGATKGLMFRAALKDGERNEFTGMTLRELAYDSLRMRGVAKRYADPMAMVGDAFFMEAGGHSTSDFAEVLSNVAKKSLLQGYTEYPETFSAWTKRGVLTDFKPTKRVGLNTFPSLAEVPEGAEYTFATIGERAVSVVLLTYGRKFAITRQAIINDDLGAFTQVPNLMGRAAMRSVGDLVYAQITPDTNPLPDSIDLFEAATHKNYAASGSGGAAPSVTTIQTGVAAMLLQKDPDGNATAGVNPVFILVPVELKGTTDVLLAAQYDPAAVAGTLTPNPIRGTLTPVVEPRLSVKSAKEWYLAASPAAADTVEVSYLNGNDQPVIEQRLGWDVDGLEFKIRLDAAAKALDYRGLYKNNGE